MENKNDFYHYERIALAIEYLLKNKHKQPSLEEIAKVVHLSPTYFQKLFKNWAGTSPKKFVEFITLAHAKRILRQEKTSLFDTAYRVGLSSTSRLHDLFIQIESMTPGEYKNEGKNLSIRYDFYPTPFGTALVASTEKGLCHFAFVEEKEKALQELKSNYPKANFIHENTEEHSYALRFFDPNATLDHPLLLHLKGTDFQLKVWEALLKIPLGHLSTYGEIAQQISRPKASRAVGTAIGSNPVAFIIPCHRVIQASGEIGGYKWDCNRKRTIIGWENARLDS